jgi:nicotinamidase/pyrazinamidase
MLASQTALIVVDAQQGFTELCPEELPIPGGAGIVGAVNALLALPFARIDATQDWHPPNHCSFFGQRDNLYPPHCVQGTRGAEFLPGLRTERFHTIWRKGYEADRDAYAVTAQHPGFAALLRAQRITTAVICGLALNICCYFTARDLRQEGLEVFLVEDASAGIDVPQAGLYQQQTRSEALRLGIQYIDVATLREQLRTA